MANLLKNFEAERNFYIPAAKCVLSPASINPQYNGRLNAQVDEWSIDFLSLDPGSEKARFIQESKLGLIAAYVYPNLPYKKILPIGKFFAWFFLADDILDNPEISASDMRNIATVYKLIFKGKYEKAASLIQSQDFLRQVRMFLEVLEELCVHMDDSTQFKTAMIEALNMFEIETRWLHSSIIPNTSTYMWMREITSGVKPCFAIMNNLQHLGLDKRFQEHPLIQKMDEIGTRHIAVSNDITSFKKEWQSGKYLNIVPILANDYKIGLNEAISKATSMIEELEKEFLKTKEEIFSDTDGLALNQSVVDYINGIEIWMSGNAEWGWLTARYHGVGWVAPDIKSITFTL